MRNLVQPRILAVLLAVLLLCPTLALARALPAGFNQTQLPANDDGSSSDYLNGAAITLPFSINFFGTTYTSVYVNNNGNLTFTGPLSTYTPFGLSGGATPIIAPFFADVDTEGVGSGLTAYGAGTYQGRQAFG